MRRQVLLLLIVAIIVITFAKPKPKERNESPGDSGKDVKPNSATSEYEYDDYGEYYDYDYYFGCDDGESF